MAARPTAGRRAIGGGAVRPQTAYYPDVIAQAAALWESLSQNHPFLDGNKRSSFAAMLAFLAINHIAITTEADETGASFSRYMKADAFASKNWTSGCGPIRKP
jgi:death-on-curing family protein